MTAVTPKLSCATNCGWERLGRIQDPGIARKAQAYRQGAIDAVLAQADLPTWPRSAAATAGAQDGRPGIRIQYELKTKLTCYGLSRWDTTTKRYRQRRRARDGHGEMTNSDITAVHERRQSAPGCRWASGFNLGDYIYPIRGVAGLYWPISGEMRPDTSSAV